MDNLSDGLKISLNYVKVYILQILYTLLLALLYKGNNFEDSTFDMQVPKLIHMHMSHMFPSSTFAFAMN